MPTHTTPKPKLATVSFTDCKRYTIALLKGVVTSDPKSLIAALVAPSYVCSVVQKGEALEVNFFSTTSKDHCKMHLRRVLEGFGIQLRG